MPAPVPAAKPVPAVPLLVPTKALERRQQVQQVPAHAKAWVLAPSLQAAVPEPWLAAATPSERSGRHRSPHWMLRASALELRASASGMPPSENSRPLPASAQPPPKPALVLPRPLGALAVAATAATAAVLPPAASVPPMPGQRRRCHHWIWRQREPTGLTGFPRSRPRCSPAKASPRPCTPPPLRLASRAARQHAAADRRAPGEARR
mmetsp:Transcript_41128/g.132308  ORF Transcript_41128/g.132308 Transcript_41128/m.132308 type:complete len:207 (+) Transcript_41128:647-1267(+)